MSDDARRLCSATEVAAGTAARFEVDGVPVALVHARNGRFYAVRDECSHERVALSEGEVVDRAIECWRHGSQFDLVTGQPNSPPATEPVPVYPVEVRGGDVYLLVPPGGNCLNSQNGVNP